MGTAPNSAGPDSRQGGSNQDFGGWDVEDAKVIKGSLDTLGIKPTKRHTGNLDKWGLPPRFVASSTSDINDKTLVRDRGRGFGVASRSDYGSYLDCGRGKDREPNSCTYNVNQGGIGGEELLDRIHGPLLEHERVNLTKQEKSDIKLYKPHHTAILTNQGKVARWKTQPNVMPKSALGPGRYKPDRADGVVSTRRKVKGFSIGGGGDRPTVGGLCQLREGDVEDRFKYNKTDAFREGQNKTKKRLKGRYTAKEISSLATKPPVPGPGEYQPLTNCKGVREIAMNRNKADVAVERIVRNEGVDIKAWKAIAAEIGNVSVLKGCKGYKSRGFGTDERWDTRFKRVGVSDEYIKGIKDAQDEVKRLDDEEVRKGGEGEGEGNVREELRNRNK
jgi:hypothetical protein